MGMIADLFVKLGFKGDEFNKGVDESKNKAEGLKASLSNMGDKIAKAFGLEGFKDNISNLVNGVGSFSSSLMKVSGGAGAFSGAMKIVRGAMISTGIGALVIAFGSLVAYFTQTERGAEMLERAMAGLKAGFKVLIDRAAMFGEGMFKLFTGDFKGGFDTLKQSISGVGEEMMKESKAASELELRLQAVDDRERGLIKSIAERKRQAAELREAAKNEDTDDAKRREMVLKARDLLNSVFKDEKSIAEERAKIERAKFEMAEKRDKVETEALNAEAKVAEIEAQRLDQMRGLTRELKAATKATENYSAANKDAYDKGVAALKSATSSEQAITTSRFVNGEINQSTHEELISRIKLNSLNKQREDALKFGQDIGQIDADIMAERLAITERMPELMKPKITKAVTKEDKSGNLITEGSVAKAGISTEEEKKQLDKVSGFISDMNGLIEGGMEDVAGTFAEGLGGLMSGDMNIGEFGASILASIGSFLVKMGQMLIAYAISMQAFKNAFSNPLVALAAGIALVAIGGMVSSMAKKGMESAGGGVSAGGTGGGATGYSPQSGASSAATAMGGNVSFQIQGSSLVGVLANNDKKNSNYK